MPSRISGPGRARVPRRAAAHRHRTLLQPEILERRDLLATAAPQILLTPAVLAGLRQEAVAHTPRWEAFTSRLDANLRVVIADDIGSYQGEQLEWIEDYALGYQVLKDIEPATAAGYADKAIGLMKSALHDYQKGSWVARQFLVRGDGATRSFALPHSDLDPATLQVYLSPVTTQAVVHGVTNGPDAVDYYRTFLKVSDAPDGTATYLPGTDWRRDTDLANDQLDWSPAGREPARGATYYVTSASIPDADATSAFALSGRTITFTVAPSRSQAVFVQYIHGTHAADGSTLAFQQTSAGDGGFNSIFIDDTYSSRHLGKPLAMGLDWLDGYVGFAAALQQEVAGMLVRWSDYLRDNGYLATHPESNMEDGAYSLRALAALALGPRNAAGPRLLADVVAYREQFLVPLLQNPTTSLNGGFWVEGWHYGHNAIQEVLLVARALETAGRIDAAAEHRWASEVVDTLASAQSAPGLAYDGGEVYDFPFRLLDRALFPILGTMAGDAAEQSYARYMGRDYPDAAFRDPSPPADYRGLLFDDPAAPTAFWSQLPLEHFASGAGLLQARSDWGATPTWVSVQMGNLLAADHQTYSPGHVQINRGADQLLINANAVAGLYGNHDENPAQVSAESNVLAIDDHGAGGQRYPFAMGVWYGSPGVVVDAYEATAGHAYLSGDYRAAYSPDETPGSGGPAAELTRQVVYLRPDVVVVYDRATTTQADYDKQLRWNLATAPAVAGNAFVETVGGSRLFGETFSSVPLTTTLTPVVIGSGADSATVQRLVVENAAPTASVRYVTAFQVASAATASRAATRRVASVDGRMEGVQVGGQVVLFGRDGTIDPSTPVAYALPATGTVTHLLTNLVAGREYAVRVNGSTLAPVTASGQGTVSFTTTATGSLTVEIGPSGTAPVLAPPGALAALATTYGTASAATGVTVAGWNLTGDVTATAPTGFQVSSDGTSFATTATFPAADGAVSGTLFVRLAATTAAGTYSGDVTISSAGATNVRAAIASSTVARKALVIRADDQTRPVNAVNPPLTATITGFVLGETAATALTGAPALATTATQASPAGAYPITVTRGTLAAKAGNYSFTGFTPGVLRVIRAPDAPRAVVAKAVAGTPGDGRVSLAWTAPASNGGTPITDYVIRVSADNGLSWTTFADGVSTATKALVTGLMNGRTYLFRVRAVNAVGVGPSSASAIATTPRTVPGIPTNVSATPGAGRVSLAWTAPAAKGGAPIIDYVIRFSADNGLTWATFADGVSTRTATTVTGLARGRAYLFRVRAVNAVGIGLSSATTAAVTG